MNVLSLFDGKSWAYAALKLAWFQIDRYFSSEVDPYPMKIAKKNFPDIIHIGDVKNISCRKLPSMPPMILWWSTLMWKDDTWLSWEKVEIDLLIGGSPCQDLSIAKKNWKGLEWEKSSLFFEYARILSEVRPKYFILENVASMKVEERDKMTKTIMEIYPDAELHMINSALVTAQNRKRYYWTNIKWVTQPEDRKILLRDILEDVPFDYNPDDKNSLWKPLDEKYMNENSMRKLREAKQIICNVHPSWKWINGNVHNIDAKSPTLTTLKWEWPKILMKWSEILWRLRWKDDLRIHAEQDKCPTLTSHLGTGWNNVPIILWVYQIPRWKNQWGIVSNGEKAPTLTTGLYEHNNKLMADLDDRYFYRKLTCIECERLQGYEDNYTEWVSASRRYQMLWNGFNKPTVAHVASFMPKE